MDGLTTEISKPLNKLNNLIEINRYWGILSPLVRRTRLEADHLTPSRAEGRVSVVTLLTHIPSWSGQGQLCMLEI
jgi:hypothetical protein